MVVPILVMTRFVDHGVEPAAEFTRPRGITREEAAAYCGCGRATFSNWVRRGIIPGPVPGTKRWDRKAIDAALDRASGLETMFQKSSLQIWRARRARADQGYS
jgi:excisionase family DNA binding protein